MLLEHWDEHDDADNDDDNDDDDDDNDEELKHNLRFFVNPATGAAGLQLSGSSHVPAALQAFPYSALYSNAHLCNARLSNTLQNNALCD